MYVEKWLAGSGWRQFKWNIYTARRVFDRMFFLSNFWPATE